MVKNWNKLIVKISDEKNFNGNKDDEEEYLKWIYFLSKKAKKKNCVCAWMFVCVF